jgi:hypothetical protein
MSGHVGDGLRVDPNRENAGAKNAVKRVNPPVR